MPPNGEGANLATLDGAELGQALAAHPDNVEAALSEFEQEMFPRSHANAVEGAEMQELFAGGNSARDLVAMFTGTD